MAVILVAPSGVHWANEVNREGRKSSVDAFLRDAGGDSECPLLPP